MSKKYKTKNIKTRESYTTKRISQEIDVHQRTVQDWIKQGLTPIENSRPYYFMGYELKRFLEEKLRNRKTKLQADEFYCIKCRKAVKPTNKKIRLVISQKTIGKQGFKSVTLKGNCENCNSKINRFSHSGKIKAIKQVFNVIEIEEAN